jgi:pimeloyl-ACP methyl ester carboxylesterase
MNGESAMSRKSKIIISIFSIISFLIICTLVGILKHREYIFATRKISSSIDIGGYKLYVNCYGKGNPTVIFESGLNGPNSDWSKVQPQISKITRTFSYDRGGIGLSDLSKLKRTSLNQVYELHSLLKNAKIKAPYIIVAHSLGGYNARLFAGTYPREVVGIVFVDCSNENQLNFLKNSSSNDIEVIKSQFSNSEQNLDELILSSNQVKEINKKDALRNIPITVISADEHLKPSQYGYKQNIEYQKGIIALSNKSKYIFVKNCGHYIQLFHPQDVINAVKEMIIDVKR